MSGDAIPVEGVIVEQHRGGHFVVATHLGAARRVLAKPCGRMVQHRIKLTVGDVVQLELSPYDPSRGRITYRGRREQREAST